MPRFAILTHDHPFPHWDFLLEDGDACRTWRLLSEPSTTCTIPAERIADHRLTYLDYEGPVSGGRGQVSRLDGGNFIWLHDAEDCIEVELHGSRFQVFSTLERHLDGDWTATFHERR
ncbi:MAG: hypothetical protein M3552_11160 [Planctomycetota bacterium]|nr:hypothetical protein [Planctomycetaceae bacterium]MDQ3331195.1 hypothetical protein [Planctomycetota bacterium]